MYATTLLLTPWMMPHKVISWQTAVVMAYLGKVEVLEVYDETIRSPSTEMSTPAVVRLKRPLAGLKRAVKFSRVNVYARDDFRCQYCGAKKRPDELSYDHVVPRVQGGITAWENIVTACHPCNRKKCGRTPEQAAMPLLKRPVKPRTLPIATPVVRDRASMPAPWAFYCAD